jgi:hypothetical protein
MLPGIIPSLHEQIIPIFARADRGVMRDNIVLKTKLVKGQVAKGNYGLAMHMHHARTSAPE